MSAAGKNVIITVLAIGTVALLYVCFVQAETIANQRGVILEMFNYIQLGCRP
jgi:hypothetical protein